MVSTGDLDARCDWVLVVCTATGVIRREVQPGAALVLGRGEHTDVDIDDDSVSRRHARLYVGDPVRIEDLGSRHGTVVLGRRLAAAEVATLPLGATAEIGAASVVVHRGRHAEARAALPAAVVIDGAMQELYALLDTIAPSAMSVLILGETGTGKEVYARAVHAQSTRAARPFVALNCASLVESLLESELFGHEKGAYTGAGAAKPGLLEMADGGTVFLDEIGELPATTQAKLLRVLENGELLRVGSVKPRHIDVRLIAATNVDLDAAIQHGWFRRDLYYRLNGFVVHLPPLRERASDILPLAHRFAAALGRTRFTEAAERALCAHAWPGNVRELKTVIERAVLLSARRGAIDVADLMLAPRRAAPTAPPAMAVAPEERERILEALQRARQPEGGRAAARVLAPDPGQEARRPRHRPPPQGRTLSSQTAGAATRVDVGRRQIAVPVVVEAAAVILPVATLLVISTGIVVVIPALRARAGAGGADALRLRIARRERAVVIVVVAEPEPDRLAALVVVVPGVVGARVAGAGGSAGLAGRGVGIPMAGGCHAGHQRGGDEQRGEDAANRVCLACLVK